MPANILITDTEPHIRGLLTVVLTQAGYSVTTAGDGETAINLSRNHAPDLLITSYTLPGLTGLDLCRAFSSPLPPNRRIPAIVITNGQPEGGVSTMPALPDNLRRIFSRPFSPRHVVSAVDELLKEAA